VLGGQTIHRPLANFLWSTCAKNYKKNYSELRKLLPQTPCGPPCLYMPSSHGVVQY